MKAVVEFSDGWRGWLINQGMVDIADSGSCTDPGVTVDGQNLLEPWVWRLILGSVRAIGKGIYI